MAGIRNNARLAIAGMTAFLLSACAGFGEPHFPVSTPEADVLARMGPPTHRYQTGGEHLLEYARGPGSQQTYMAQIDSHGRLASFEQVLTSRKFAMIKVGIATKDDVLHTIGTPSETSFINLRQLEVWSYPYKENGVWDSMMHVHFDKQGIVRDMMNGPDPSRDPDMRFPFGHHRK